MHAIGAGSGVEVVVQSDLDDDGEPSFIEQGKSEYDSKRPKQQPPYNSTLHISPTSLNDSLVDVGLLCVRIAA